jgi:hypothetical protein
MVPERSLIVLTRRGKGRRRTSIKFEKTKMSGKKPKWKRRRRSSRSSRKKKSRTKRRKMTTMTLISGNTKHSGKYRLAQYYSSR